jgi:hypothetical protein
MKYELTDETIQHFGRTLRRIKALTSFSDVSNGDLGGFVESVGNLSPEGDAWVYGNARVYGDAQVYGNARVSGDARVYGEDLCPTCSPYVKRAAESYSGRYVYAEAK